MNDTPQRLSDELHAHIDSFESIGDSIPQPFLHPDGTSVSWQFSLAADYSESLPDLSEFMELICSIDDHSVIGCQLWGIRTIVTPHIARLMPLSAVPIFKLLELYKAQVPDTLQNSIKLAILLAAANRLNATVDLSALKE